MKNKKVTDQYLDEKLSEIKSGEVFDTPEGYFEQLEARLFQERRSEFMTEDARPRKSKVIKLWKPIAYAASFLLAISLAWWVWKGGDQGDSDLLTYDALLEQYLIEQIMEYDMDYLTSGLDDEDLLELSSIDMSQYEAYIDAYIEDFEEFIY